jgi:uncharacterized membrane protein
VEYVEKSIDVALPVHAVYDQWTQFEEFPEFMEGVKEVKQLDDQHLSWRAEVAGKEETWEAEISEQVPDYRIAWHSTSGAQNAGRVSFEKEDGHTLVTLQLGYDPHGVAENIGDKMGFMSRQVEHDLKRFRDFIEKRGQETGAWRGKIHGSHVEKPGQHKRMV